MSTISAGTTTTTALVQTGDTTGALVIKTNNGNTTAATFSTAGDLTVSGTITANGSAITSSQWVTSGSNIYYNTGSVGIGTSSPVGKLQIAQTNNTTINGGAYLNLGKSENGVGGYHLVGMGYNPGSNYAPTYMGYVETANNAGTAGDLVFFTRPSGNADTVAPTERLRLDSSGNLGLGVTPSAWGSTFRAYQTGVGSAFYGRTNYGPQVGMSANFLNNGSALVYIGNGYASRYEQNDGAHAWYTAPSGTAGNAITFTQAMTLDASGNLGIGTTSPSGRLNIVANNLSDGFVVQGNDNANTKVRLTNSGSGGESWNIQVGQPGASNSEFVIYSNTATAQRMRLDSSGNLLFNSGYGSVATAYGCRAWVNFNGTVATPTIRGSGNVTSITKNGTGDYTVTFSASMPDTNYATTASARHSAGALSTFISVQTVGLGSVRVQNYNSGGTLYDDDTISVVVHR